MKKAAKNFDQILSVVEREATREKFGDGILKTAIPFLTFIRGTKTTPLNRGILNPSFCVILQGRKSIHIGNEVIHYGVGEFLVASIHLPAAGQIVGASKTVPYYALGIQLDAKEIASIVIEAKIDVRANREAVSGAFVGKSDPELMEAISRLVKVLDRPRDAEFLANSIKREIIYRLLTSKDGHLLYQNVVLSNYEDGIGKAIYWIKNNFARPIKMESLAKSVNMSVSSLHHKFKAVMTMGPLQYQKQLRLQEARRLLLAGVADVAEAAYKVGYESQSQFTREYRRLFGAPPMKDVKSLRTKGGESVRPRAELG
jgi:AraC-like DNA-binding protein